PAQLRTLSLHDALPICSAVLSQVATLITANPELQSNPVVAKTQETAQTYVMGGVATTATKELGIYTRTTASADGGKFGSLLLRRSEEHTSELQSRRDLV